MEEETESDEGAGGSPINIELVRSYLTFIRRAVQAHKVLLSCVLVVCLVLTGLVARYIPRTYSCTTVLMTVENAVLDANGGGRPLVGAAGLLTRRSSLEALIESTDLVHKVAARRPPLLKLKAQVTQALFGAFDDKTQQAILVGTLENKLFITTTSDTLEIRVEWTDGETAAELAEATKAAFLEMRHNTEISAFQEKMGILDAHAATLRQEIDSIAAQMKAALETKAAEVAQEKNAAASSAASSKPSRVSVPAAITAPAAAETMNEQLDELRERLATQKQKLAAAENERSARMSAERAKLEELKLRLTPNHPQVIFQEERLGVASNVPSDLAMLRDEVADMESQLRQRKAMAKTPGSTGARSGGGAAAAAAAEVLPNDVLRLLGREDVDPAVSAQMSGAVVRYGALRDEVRGAQLALDTAQVAFNHRYQVAVPAEVPNRPVKPNVTMIAAVGALLSLLLAIGIPALVELRRGILMDRWQIDGLQLPVLAELRLPSRGDD